METLIEDPFRRTKARVESEGNSFVLLCEDCGSLIGRYQSAALDGLTSDADTHGCDS